MNIRFKELDNKQNNNSYNFTNDHFQIQEKNIIIRPNFYQTYYDNQNNNNQNNNQNNNIIETKNKKVTFDDILNNMNMTVIDGTLQLNTTQIN